MAKNSQEMSELFKDLHDAIDADKLYWLRNDAKIRAVTTAQSYDEFKNIWQAAHLSPVTKEDKKKRANTGWNSAFH